VGEGPGGASHWTRLAFRASSLTPKQTQVLRTVKKPDRSDASSTPEWFGLGRDRNHRLHGPGILLGD